MQVPVTVKPLAQPRHWEIVEGFAYAGVQVPAGFKTDGCSIPIGLRWRFKHGGAKFAPACMHDFLYKTGVVSKERADEIFFELMMANGVNRHDALIMYTGVKYGGFMAWNKHRRNDK